MNEFFRKPQRLDTPSAPPKADGSEKVRNDTIPELLPVPRAAVFAAQNMHHAH